MGEPKLWSTVPPCPTLARSQSPRRPSPCARQTRPMFLPVSSLRSYAGGVLCRRFRSPRRCRSEQGAEWGVSDPHLAAPFFAPRAARRGSLTPHMQVTIIRRDSAMPVTTAECGARCRARCARRSHYCARVCQVLPGNCVHIG